MLLIIGGAFTALIVLIVIIAVATAKPNSIKPAAAPSASPTAVSYSTVTSLLGVLAAHDAGCSNVSLKYGSVPGQIGPLADCSGITSGDTAIVIFTDHASAVAYAHSMVTNPTDPTAEVVGPNWTVNTSPAFAAKVVKAIGGQLITAPATSAAPATPATSAPASSAPAVPASQTPAAPTASQQQALTSAQGYLSDGQGFSRAGLIAQLDSPDGGQFSVADATWAVDNSGANWDAQAVIAAKGYLSDGQGFSRQGLIDQLDSPDGGQFTYAQAVYGVDGAGL